VAIGLSVLLLPYCKPKEITNTILHEIAHALTPGHKHDYVWRQKFIEIGGDGTMRGGEHCYSEENTKADVRAANSVYKGTCSKGHVHYRNALGRGRSYSCNHCSPGRYDSSAIITWQRNPDRKHVRLR
jgi:predicted SprT family Zn-dependent metalloprotease